MEIEAAASPVKQSNPERAAAADEETKQLFEDKLMRSATPAKNEQPASAYMPIKALN